MMWLCSNCKVPMPKEETEDGNCPTCGMTMEEKENQRHNIEFDLMLTALLYGKKP